MLRYYEDAERAARHELTQEQEVNEQLCRELAELESENSSLEKIEERVLSLEGDERKFVEHEHELDSAIERKQVNHHTSLFNFLWTLSD